MTCDNSDYTTQPLVVGTNFFDTVTENIVEIIGMWVDEDGDTVVKIKDGEDYTTLEPNDIRKRLKNEELVDINEISVREEFKLEDTV